MVAFAAFSVSSVMSTYAPDSNRPVTVSVLSASSLGSAMRRPDIYWLDTPPSIAYSPGTSRPLQQSRAPCFCIAMPCAPSTASSGASGLSPSLPSIINTASAPSAPTIGRRKRNVEPDSPQCSSHTPSGAAVIGSMCIVSPVRAMLAPSAFMQLIVASISFDVPRHSMLLALFASEASIISLCAYDLDDIMSTLPVRAPRLTVRVIARHHPSASPAYRRTIP